MKTEQNESPIPETTQVPNSSLANFEMVDNTETQDEFRAKTVTVMERLHASDVFATPEKAKEFLDTLTYKDFKRFISFVNGVERGIVPDKRGKAGDSLVQSESAFMGVEVEYRPPHKSYRDKLLEMAFDKARTIKDPALAGLTLGLSINAIHYFEDGNGRTARMTFALLSRGYDGSEEDQTFYSSLLENTKGRDVINPNPAISGIDKKIRSEMFEIIKDKYNYDEAFKNELPTYVFDGYPDAFAGEYTPDDLTVSDDIDAQGRRMLHDTLQSGGITMISLMRTFPPERISEFVNTSSRGHRFVDGNSFLPTLSKDEIYEWWNSSELSIANYVKRIIEISDREDSAELLAEYTE